jgi:hypothetical protein
MVDCKKEQTNAQGFDPVGMTGQDIDRIKILDE